MLHIDTFKSNTLCDTELHTPLTIAMLQPLQARRRSPFHEANYTLYVNSFSESTGEFVITSKVRLFEATDVAFILAVAMLFAKVLQSFETYQITSCKVVLELVHSELEERYPASHRFGMVPP